MKKADNSSVKILQAALRLFSEKGYEATSTREICEFAGITKPTLYYFYQSKEGVYRALVKNATDEFLALVDRGLDARGDLRRKYKRVAELVFADATRRPLLWRFTFAIVWSIQSPISCELHECYQAAICKMARAAQAAAKAGDIKAGALGPRMLVVMGALAEALSNFLIMNKPRLTRKLADSVIDTVLDGWTGAAKTIRT